MNTETKSTMMISDSELTTINAYEIRRNPDITIKETVGEVLSTYCDSNNDFYGALTIVAISVLWGGVVIYDVINKS